MTAGQWEQFEAPAAKAMEQFWAHLRGHTDEPDEIDFALANAVLNVVGPLIAEDTRDRLVAAAGEAVERQPMVDAGRLAAWLRHEISGAASQREVDAYDRVLRMVGGGGQDVSERLSQDKLAAVRKLHAASPVPQPSQFTTWCSNCNCAWPCPTAKILDGVASDAEEWVATAVPCVDCAAKP